LLSIPIEATIFFMAKKSILDVKNLKKVTEATRQLMISPLMLKRAKLWGF
jgi:hypothetical protein